MTESNEQRVVLEEENLRRETWCQVELDPRQTWERPEMKHFRCHLRTSRALRSAQPAGGEHRSAWADRPPPAKHVERRHFQQSYKTHLA